VKPDEDVRLLWHLKCVVPLGNDNFSVLVLDIVVPDELASESEFVPVADSGDADGVELEHKVVERHPESAVLAVERGFDFLLHLFGPEVGLVAPVALPLEVGPGVPQVEQLVALGLDDLDD